MDDARVVRNIASSGGGAPAGAFVEFIDGLTARPPPAPVDLIELIGLACSDRKARFATGLANLAGAAQSGNTSQASRFLVGARAAASHRVGGDGSAGMSRGPG